MRKTPLYLVLILILVFFTKVSYANTLMKLYSCNYELTINTSDYESIKNLTSHLGVSAQQQVPIDDTIKIPAKRVTNTEDEWTILVYLDGDNDLEQFAIKDLNEMESVQLPNNINVVVQIDRIDNYDNSNGNWTDTRIYEVKKDNDPKQIGSLLIKEQGELNMGNPQTLTDFINFGVEKYPAKKYMLIMWNHGGGWREMKEMQNDNLRGISWDLTSGNDYLEMREVKAALKSAKQQMNVIGFDACLMGMVEIAYQIKDVVKDIAIFSQDVEPGDGWDYESIFGNLKTNPSAKPAELAKYVIDSYQSYYSGVNTTMSAVDLTKTGDLKNTINNFVMAFNKMPEWNLLSDACDASPNFQSRANYIDLYQFMNHIAIKSNYSDTKIAAEKVIETLKYFIIDSRATGSHQNKAKGINIYFRKKSDSEWNSYNSNFCDFAGDSYWSSLLNKYVINHGFKNQEDSKPIILFVNGSTNITTGNVAANVKMRVKCISGALICPITFTINGGNAGGINTLGQNIWSEWQNVASHLGSVSFDVGYLVQGNCEVHVQVLFYSDNKSNENSKLYAVDQILTKDEKVDLLIKDSVFLTDYRKYLKYNKDDSFKSNIPILPEMDENIEQDIKIEEIAPKDSSINSNPFDEYQKKRKEDFEKYRKKRNEDFEKYKENKVSNNNTNKNEPCCLPEMYNSKSLNNSTKNVIKVFIEGSGESTLECELYDGKYIFEGDIVIANYDEKISKGSIIPYISSRWQNNIVPYIINNSAGRDKIINAMAHISSKSDIKFVPRTTQNNYVEFINDPDGCWSYVGVTGGKQQIGLSKYCDFGNAVHEICHTLGIWHEQSRNDRDRYVTIDWSNIIESTKHNFEKHTSDGLDVGSYDYGSIMHYPKYAFAINTNKPTIIPKNNAQIGQRSGLSNGDINAIRNLYSKSKENEADSTANSYNSATDLEGITQNYISGDDLLTIQNLLGENIIKSLHNKNIHGLMGDLNHHCEFNSIKIISVRYIDDKINVKGLVNVTLSNNPFWNSIGNLPFNAELSLVGNMNKYDISYFSINDKEISLFNEVESINSIENGDDSNKTNDLLVSDTPIWSIPEGTRLTIKKAFIIPARENSILLNRITNGNCWYNLILKVNPSTKDRRIEIGREFIISNLGNGIFFRNGDGILNIITNSSPKCQIIRYLEHNLFTSIFTIEKPEIIVY